MTSEKWQFPSGIAALLLVRMEAGTILHFARVSGFLGTDEAVC